MSNNGNNGEFQWDEDDLFFPRQKPPKPMSRLERRFWKFHDKNPIVEKILTEDALLALEAGQKKGTGSIQLLYERARQELRIPADDHGLKLDNNHTAFYSRLIEKNEPRLKGFFRQRKQRIQSSFGPDNDDLPPGDHIA